MCIVLSPPRIIPCATTIKNKVSLFIICISFSRGDYCVSFRRQASIHLRTRQSSKQQQPSIVSHELSSKLTN